MYFYSSKLVLSPNDEFTFENEDFHIIIQDRAQVCAIYNMNLC